MGITQLRKALLASPGSNCLQPLLQPGEETYLLRRKVFLRIKAEKTGDTILIPRFLFYYLNIFLAGGWGHFESGNLAMAHLSFNHGAVGGVNLKIHIPVLRSGWKQENLAAVGLNQHSLNCLQQHPAVVLVRNPVVVWSPEGRKARAFVPFPGLPDHIFPGLLGQA